MSNFYGGVTSAEAEAFLYDREREAAMQASPGSVTRLPSQAVMGNTYGVMTRRDWRKVARQQQERQERARQHREDMQAAFGPQWPNLPPGAAEDPSLL